MSNSVAPPPTSDPSQDATVSIRAENRVLAGRYTLEGLIGSGGFGSVFRARDANLQRTVAVKLLRTQERNSDVVRRFEREAVVLARLEAPEIVPVYDYGVDDGEFFIVMQYVDGETLAARLVRSHAMAPVDAIAIGRAICNALVIAHRQRIVHRDLKPSNIMLCADGAVRLLDFGISKPLDAGDLTQSHVIGTPLYMSPEQANGLPIDERSDIFSLGCVLFEMLTGSRAFTGKTFAEQILAVTHQQPDIAALVEASVPQPLLKIVARCLEKDPAERYASAQAVLDHLNRALAATDDTSVHAELRGWQRIALVTWPLVAVVGMLGFFAVTKGFVQWQDAACLIAFLPLLWIGRSYWRYLHWQYGVLLFSLFIGPMVLSSTIPIFAHQYTVHGWLLPLATRQFIVVATTAIRYLFVALIAATLIAKPVLRRRGYSIVRILNATPSRLTAFVLALVVMGGIATEFRLLANDYFDKIQTKPLSDPDLLSAFHDAARTDLRQPLVSNGGMLDPRLRFGKLLLESGLPLNAQAGNADVFALFERIPAAAANRVRYGPLDVLKWWAANLESVRDSTAARRYALTLAHDLSPDDSGVNRMLAELDFASGRYVTALQGFESEALRTGDAALAARAVSMLAARGRCEDARLFVRDFVGRKIIDQSRDALPLPDLLVPCRTTAPR